MSATSRSVPPPSPMEVTRKLSMHSRVPPKKPHPPSAPLSGNESDSDSVFSPDTAVPSTSPSGAMLATSPSQQPHLSSIAERRSSGGEESEEDEDEEGGWRAAGVSARERGALDATVLMTGYLWKKGERRKTWKKRWFVLRPAHLAFYKTSAEYKLLRLLDLTEVHACTPVILKKHANTFGLVSPTRTFYLQAESPREVQEWVQKVNEARTALLATSSQNSGSSPVPIPAGGSAAAKPAHAASQMSSSLSQSPHGHHLTSSDSDDASPARPMGGERSPAAHPGDAPKVVLSGYLMKCGSRRHNWHKRWFVLSGEKLVYSRSHMDTKPHREVPLSQILDALEYDLPPHRHGPTVSSPPSTSPPQASSSAADEADGTHGRHTFKVVTTKRTLLLCAPSEEEEIKWLSAVRALIARRSGAGVVPGDGPSTSGRGGASLAAPTSESGLHSGNGAPGGGVGGPAGTGAGKRRDSFARRLSLSGGAALANIVPQQAPQTQQEAASERQS
ncbi:PH-domain-containing protein [Wolfiporia cocos MD-104 SS10]|uniref:PH-domain-containing protein n=1 Tax=Wolfiporia cocos (strain MD-104) TaxID=742152 RepID=A0A2H3JBV9_WOLCO|nr:PH-domain-containing protein [Wolfiporia cocos MD-104 SS10]